MGEQRQRRWLKWVGLQEQPADPEAWMAVAKDLGVDDTATGFCAEAARIIQALQAAGIEAEQRSYVLPDRGRISNLNWGTLAGGQRAADRVRIAVVVRNRQLDQADAVMARLGPPPAGVSEPPTPQSAGFSPGDVTNGGVPDN